VVKVIWHKVASPPQTDGSIVFAMWRQWALRQWAFPWGHTGATWRIRLNLCLLRPTSTRVHIPNGKSIGSADSFAQLTAESPYTLQRVPLFPKTAPSSGMWTPSNTTPWAHPRPQPKQHLDLVYSFFGQMTAECPRVSRSFPVKTAPSHGGIWTRSHLIHGSLGPPESSTQTASEHTAATSQTI